MAGTAVLLMGETPMLRNEGGLMNRMSVLLVIVVIGFTCFQPVQAQQPLQLTMDTNSIWVRAGESPILQYRYGDVPFKPYVKELYTPAGLNILLDAPPDHQHHHGLMFAVAADGVNFWEETPTAGRQVQAGHLIALLQGKDEGGPGAGFCTGVAWKFTSGNTCLFESRIIKVCEVDRLGATVVTWQSELAAWRPQRPVTLSGSHYFGLGMRFVRSMDGGEFFNADGKEGTIFRGEERLVRSNWCAYTASIDGKPVTVAMLGYPANPRHPTTWFTMAEPFAYLSGTLNLHEEPLIVEVGKPPLLLRYAIVAWDGKVGKDRVDEAYRWFTDEYPMTSGGLMALPESDPNK